jgi:hypothetical protein
MLLRLQVHRRLEQARQVRTEIQVSAGLPSGGRYVHGGVVEMSATSNARRRLVWVFLLWWLAAQEALSAQQVTTLSDTASRENGIANSACPKAPNWLRCGQLPRLQPAEARRLLSNLAALAVERWPELIRGYFGDLYSPSFTDLVVFISRTGVIKQALISNGRFQSKGIVRGKQYVFVLVFADTSLETPTSDESLSAEAKDRARHMEPVALQCHKLGLNCTVALTSSGGDAPATSGMAGALIARRIRSTVSSPRS